MTSDPDNMRQNWVRFPADPQVRHDIASDFWKFRQSIFQYAPSPERRKLLAKFRVHTRQYINEVIQLEMRHRAELAEGLKRLGVQRW